jgi:ferritin-like metal-binding protein YciE
MLGLIQEGSELIEEEAGDAALICAAQKVEHYEIATYGSLASWAELLQQSDAAHLLQQTLAEEKETDERLTELAESVINAQESQEEEEQEPRRRKAA